MTEHATVAAAKRAEAALMSKLPTIMQLLQDQDRWIRQVMESGDLPAEHDTCGCMLCRRHRKGQDLIDRFRRLTP